MSPDADKFAQVIESARSMVEEQFRISERLDRKVRYQAGTAGAFFAVVQAVVVNAAVRAQGLDDWTTTLAIFAVPATLITIGAFVAATGAWRTQTEKDLPIQDLRAMVEGVSHGDENTSRNLAFHYLNLAEQRRIGNAERLNRVRRVADITLLSIVLTGAELALVFVGLANHRG
jgi:hypothetical protein